LVKGNSGFTKLLGCKEKIKPGNNAIFME